MKSEWLAAKSVSMQFRGSQPWRTVRARGLRDRQTSAEWKLWQRLRGRRLGGFKFSRQVPIGPYFADFACRSRRVIVEVDGATHGLPDEQAADLRRTAVLEQHGYMVHRVLNADVHENIDGVCETILVVLQTRSSMSD
ncbi:MAG: DUF559 domain-containing protein [Pseudomonadota bacterium]